MSELFTFKVHEKQFFATCEEQGKDRLCLESRHVLLHIFQTDNDVVCFCKVRIIIWDNEPVTQDNIQKQMDGQRGQYVWDEYQKHLEKENK